MIGGKAFLRNVGEVRTMSSGDKRKRKEGLYYSRDGDSKDVQRKEK